MGLIKIALLGGDTSMLEPLLDDTAGMQAHLGRNGYGGVHGRDVVAGGAFVKSASDGRLDDRQAHALRLRKLVGQHQAEAAVELRHAADEANVKRLVGPSI